MILKAQMVFWFTRSLILLTFLISLLGFPMGGVAPMSAGYAAPLPLLNVVIPSDRVDEISVEKISQFIQAYLEVIHLLEAHQTDLHRNDPATPSEQAAIEQEALNRIESAGLTRQEYLQLLNLANSDPDFSDRIAMQLQEFGHD
jgi:Domain of unknown function (DUF4168)